MKTIAGGVAEKASSGLGYVKGKIFGEKDQINSTSSYAYTPPNYDDDSGYTQMSDNKRNSLIDRYNY
jgi:hypothetical protein